MAFKPIRLAVGGLVAIAALVAGVVWLELRDEAVESAPDVGRAVPDGVIQDAPPSAHGNTVDAQTIERGAYLARVGHCATCHTARGGAVYAGGRGVATPFGTVYAGNLTPDADTGLGRWTLADFWRALHHGRSRDGRLLYPAFPYPSYTQVTRADSDALFAHLRSLPAVRQRNRPHALRFPYDSQPALALWRAAFFRAGTFEPAPARSAQWNRGAYLVRGLGHCAECHAPRNRFGATRDALALRGGEMPMQRWYAPSLASAQEAGVADWEVQAIVDLLRTGTVERGALPPLTSASGTGTAPSPGSPQDSPQGGAEAWTLHSTSGPMAEVVFSSTQHWQPADLHAVAVYLKDLPPQQDDEPPEPARVDAAVMAQGEKLYARHCADCHGDEGQGARGAYPPLAGNRSVTMAHTGNLIQQVLHGGFAPATAGNPRPYGMPPLRLGDADTAAVLSYIRQAWGHAAAPVSELDVLRGR